MYCWRFAQGAGSRQGLFFSQRGYSPIVLSGAVSFFVLFHRNGGTFVLYSVYLLSVQILGAVQLRIMSHTEVW